MKAVQFVQALADRKLFLTPRQEEQFRRYFQLLIEWNQKMNLTTLTAEEEVYLKHFYDSLTPAFYLDFSSVQKVADIGSGAGFPGLPLKICFPQLQLTIVDALKKRLLFLEHVLEALQISGVCLVHARAEEAGRNHGHREQYELVMARAVARLSVLAELCLPFVQVGGLFVAMKGAKGEEEAREAEGAIRKLGGRLEKLERFHLPCAAGERHLLLIKKLKPTPSRYPRQPGIPAKKPLS